MAGFIPDEGELQHLAEHLAAGEDWLLGLITTDLTPSESDTASTWTALEASFSGYARKTLTRAVGPGNWGTPTSGAPVGSWSSESNVASSLYNVGTPQTWTAGTGASATVYGYFYLGATSGKLAFAEKLAVAQPIVEGTVISIVPYFGFA